MLLNVALVGLLLACSGSTATPSPSTNLGAEYLQIVAAGNTTVDQLNAALSAQPSDSAKIRAAAKAVFDGDVKLSTDLLAFEQKVPANVKPHVEAARSVLSKQIADLQNVIASTDDPSLNADLIAYDADAQAGASAFVLLRSDLGLPPPSLGSPSASPST
jgi:hypothetical protein